MNPLVYVPASTPDDCKLKISPSSFGTFITRPWQWYRQQILGIDKFEYNTSSAIGTIVHYCAEMVAKDEPVNEDHIEEYIDSMEPNETYCPDTVRSSWYAMAETLVNDYVLKNKDNFLEVESQVCQEVRNAIYGAGTLDLLEGTKEDCMLTDYKTYNSKTKPKAFDAGYKYQLLVYAWALRKKGYNVTRIRLVYVNRYIDGGISEKTNKPLKSYPPEVTVLTEQITDEDIQFTESQLMLCVDKLEASENYPSLLSAIWHDPRLKEI